MSTCNRLDLQTLGSQPVMSKNLPDHWWRVQNGDFIIEPMMNDDDDQAMEWLWWLWHGYGSQERTHAFYSEVGTAKNCSLTWRGGGVALDHGDLFPFSQDHATGICAQTSDSSNRQTQTQTYAAWLKIPRCRLTAGISSTREQAILGGERERERGVRDLHP